MCSGISTPDIDSIVVERVKAAGAIVLGKTNTSEFGQSGTIETKVSDPCRTPWNTNHTSGGSSGGAGAALGRRALHHRNGKRRRRVHPHSGQLQRRLRHKAHPAPGAPLRRVRPTCGQPLLPVGAYEPHRGRHGPASTGAGGSGQPGPQFAQGDPSGLQRGTGQGRRGNADRLESRLRIRRGAPGGGGGDGACRPRV